MLDDQATTSDLSETYDVTIVGAGVVGCAMARRFAMEGATVLIVEKAPDILDGASKANSAILHTGFDAPFGSLELDCIKTGYQEYLDIHKRLNLPIMETGAIVVAWNEEEEARLADLMDHARANGITDIEPLTAAQVTQQETHLSTELVAGFRVPGEFVVDPWTTPYAYLQQALDNGAHVLRNTEIVGGEFNGEQWHLITRNGAINCRTIINCAGLYGDHLESALMGESSFEIRPRKGQFLVYDKPASNLVNAIILPVPSETTKGIVVCRTIFGNVLVGPTAEEQEGRDDASVHSETLIHLQRKAEQMVPGLAQCTITATYAGIRPATEHKDYRIRHDTEKHYIAVGGIRSTGLSAALGIASHVFGVYTNAGNAPTAPTACIWPAIPSIAEAEQRDWARPDNGGIVCHCELVTKREIDVALDGPLAAQSLAGLKRRTRVTMGRCQGFYCSARLSEITAGKFRAPLALGHIDE